MGIPIPVIATALLNNLLLSSEGQGYQGLRTKKVCLKTTVVSQNGATLEGGFASNRRNRHMEEQQTSESTADTIHPRPDSTQPQKESVGHHCSLGA